MIVYRTERDGVTVEIPLDRQIRELIRALRALLVIVADTPNALDVARRAGELEAMAPEE